MKSATAPALTRPSGPLQVIAFCLTAPAPPADTDPISLRNALEAIIKRANHNLRALPGAPKCTAQLKHLLRGELTESAIRAHYDTDSDLAADVYLVRAFAERPDQALSVVEKRRYLEATVAPETDAELTLDRTIVVEQLTAAALVTQPERLPAIEAMFSHFRREYIRRYTAHHDRYWSRAATLYERMVQAKSRANALALLNTLSELGAAVGVAAMARHSELLAAGKECAFSGDLQEALTQRPTCPGCEITLSDEPPAAEIEDTLDVIDRSIERQMERLTSTAISRALANSGDPRIDHFLKVVQASQLSSLAAAIDLLDEELVGYLRRFLLESRIHGLLEPLLERVQRGDFRDGPEVRERLDEIARTIERGLRTRALPEPQTSRPVKSKRRA